MIRAMLESPLKGDYERNRAYARACMRDALLVHGEAPFAMHLLYAQEGILDDTNPTERKLGIAAGLEWSRKADAVVVYTDLGITEGMALAIEKASSRRIPIVYRNGVWRPE
jgi:hypothetical protein